MEDEKGARVVCKLTQSKIVMEREMSIRQKYGLSHNYVPPVISVHYIEKQKFPTCQLRSRCTASQYRLQTRRLRIILRKQHFATSRTTYFEFVIGPQTIQTTLILSHVKIEVDDVVNSSSDVQHNTNHVENMVTSVGMKGIKATVSFLLAIFEEDISRIPLGPLLNSNYTLPCLLSSVAVASLTQLEVSIETMEYVKLKGFVSSDISIELDKSWATLRQTYRDELDALLPSVMKKSCTGYSEQYVKRACN